MTAERVYAALLRLYPKSFRDEYGAEVQAAFRQLQRSTGKSRVAFWSFVAADVARSAAIAQVDEWRRGPRQIALRLAASSAAGLTATAVAAHGTTWLYGYFYHPYLEGIVIPVLPYGIALGFVLGGTVGLAQWLLLPARVRRTSAWALASAIAMPIALIFCSAAVDRALAGLNPVAAGLQPLPFDLLAVGLSRTGTWRDLAVQFAAMAASALVVRSVMRTSRKPLRERRHAH
jgi:hypothetical protein